MNAQAAYDEWHSILEADEKSDAPWHDLIRAHLDLSANLDGKRVLEIGCGRGGFSVWLASQAKPKELVAADLSDTALEKGRQLAKRMGLRNITWQRQDIQALDFQDATFDTAISCETIEHVPDPRKALRELARVLKPGGQLFLTVPNYFGSFGLYRFYLMLRGRRFTEAGQPINQLTLTPLTRVWLRQAGFSDVLLDGVGHYLPFPGRRPIRFYALDRLRWLSRWTAHHSLLVARKRA